MQCKQNITGKEKNSRAKYQCLKTVHYLGKCVFNVSASDKQAHRYSYKKCVLHTDDHAVSVFLRAKPWQCVQAVVWLCACVFGHMVGVYVGCRAVHVPAASG